MPARSRARAYHSLTLVFALFVSVAAYAQQRAVREDGVAVILHPDGRWEIAPAVTPVVAPGVVPAAAPVRVFFGNLHSHTSYSDGQATPADAYDHARDVAGIDFLAVTEHNHSQAGGAIARDHTLYNGARTDSLISTAARFDQPGRFVALYGQEFSSISSGNHANVLDVGEVIDETEVPNGRWDNLLNTWLPAHLDSQGLPAIMLLNHPAESSSPNAKEYGIDDFPNAMSTWRTKLDDHAELINIVNGPSHDGTEPGEPSESEFLRYLNMGFHVAPTADQDNHRQNWGDAAPTRTGVWAATLSKADILTALRERHAYATQDQNLRLIGTVNGSLMGTRFTGASVPAVNTPLAISLTIDDADEPSAEYTVDVFRDTVGGNAVADIVAQHEQVGNGTLAINDVAYTGGEQYVFLRVRQLDEAGQEDHAWLAPVWFEPNGAAPPVGPPPSGPTPGATASLTLQVDVAAEEAVITNTGSAAVNLRDWTLVSTIGPNQRFKFTTALTLAPGQSVTVTSGPAARTGTGFVKWTNDFIWRNSGDPGQLLDPAGVVRAESP
jgi:hypothetical protein